MYNLEKTFFLIFRKMRDVLQQRIIRFLLDQSKKEPEKYASFFEDYGLFMREGIVTTAEQDVKVRERLMTQDPKRYYTCVSITESLVFTS